MMPKLVFLWTDLAFFAVLFIAVYYAYHVSRTPNLRQTWRRVAHNTAAMCSLIILLFFLAVGVLDSLHYRERLPVVAGQTGVAYAPQVKSVFDLVVEPLAQGREKTYSAPLAIRQFYKETELINGQPIRHFPLLRYPANHLSDPSEHYQDVIKRTMMGLVVGVGLSILSGIIMMAMLAQGMGMSISEVWAIVLLKRSPYPWLAMLITLSCMLIVIAIVSSLSQVYHVLGTDVAGNNVLLMALKSIRTALIIGSLTTLATLPFALSLGLMAGYFRSWVDELIQYVYSVLGSIPSVLLISACILMVQVFIDKNPETFETGLERADIRFFLLCLILGVTSWVGLCRLLRAESLKLREMEYVQAARAFGVPSLSIIRRHLLPNVMHIVLISVVLEFSSLILFEAVLSYVGVGVDPQMNSFGVMINMARSEVARDPIVWWNVTTAFVMMLLLVLSANLFADGIREAFDPRAISLRPKWRRLIFSQRSAT